MIPQIMRVVEERSAATLVSDAAFSATGAENVWKTPQAHTDWAQTHKTSREKPWKGCQIDYNSVMESL